MLNAIWLGVLLLGLVSQSLLAQPRGVPRSKPRPAIAARMAAAEAAWKEGMAIHERADAIAVVRTIRGTATPERTAVDFDVRVQVLRVLKGRDLSGGQELNLAFRDDRPPFALPSPQPVQPATGIVFLARDGDAWQPIRQDGPPGPGGGFLLHLPEGSGPALAGDEEAQVRVGRELAAALEHWGANASASLDARGGFGPFPARQPAGPEAGWFLQAAEYLNGPVADPAPFAEIYRELSRSGSPHVRLVGIIGRIKLQQAEGLQALAQTLPQSMKAAGAGMLVDALRRWDVSRQPGSVDVLGGIALAEATHAQVESAASWALGQHALVDALPYLATLLESPHPPSRAGALMGICNLHRGGDPRASLKDYSGEEARPHCPDRIPVMDAEAERRHLAFWREWWASHRDVVEKDFRGDGAGRVLPFARAAAPARWFDARQPASQMSQASPEQALRLLLRMFDPAVTARAQGQVSDAARVRAMLSVEADERDITALAEELQKAARALRQVDEEFRRDMMEHRLAGRPPDPRFAEQANARASEVTAAFLRETQSRLSPGAWRQLQEAIARRARDLVQVSFPAPPGRP